MEDLLFSILNPVFSLVFWLIISPDARPWLFATWAFTLVLSTSLLWLLLTDKSGDR